MPATATASAPTTEPKSEDPRLTDEESQTGTNENAAEDDSMQETIVGYETRLVQYSRAIFIGAIVIAALTMGCITYLLLRNGEEKAYKNHFQEVTTEIVQVSQTRARQIFDNIEGLSTFFTSYTLAANATWPFVVIPDFQVHALVASQITGAATLTIHPLVSEDDKDKWETFSQDTYMGWMEESSIYDSQVNPDLYIDQRKTSMEKDINKEDQRWNVTGIVPHIWKEVDGNLSGIPAASEIQYFPEWQRAPLSDYNPFTNLDMASHPVFQNTIEGMIETDHPVLTDVTDASFLLNKYDRRFSPEQQKEPHSYLLQPIHDDLKLDRNTVGFLSAFLRWGTFFENVLPEYETGIMIVLHGTCGRQFSYILNGNHAEFLGDGDLHNVAYDDIKLDFEIAPFARLEDSYCQYSARIYPSDTWTERFYTTQPIRYAAAVTCCFIVTVILFVIYDILVQHRQKKVMDTAERSSAIVSNLFPATVRHTLMKEALNDDSVTEFADVTSNGVVEVSPATSKSIFGSDPIAELFPESTIMFADLAGFTAWSAQREPKDVFLLLETIYFAFDTIAKRRRVFKVETIGDCYVACCGLPRKNVMHAVVMSKFANDCLNKMSKLVVELEPVLGPGTESLALRVGLHSGPVTAGVLRGDKGRFQLFGDSMNTASRMESTGLKNKIQISAATSEFLSVAGKEWATPREDKIIAKGKGEMQTYWLEVPARGNRYGLDPNIHSFMSDNTSTCSDVTPTKQTNTAAGVEIEDMSPITICQ